MIFILILMAGGAGMASAQRNPRYNLIKKNISHFNPLNENKEHILVSSTLPTVVSPLITDKWHQESDPYLRFTPTDSTGTHCVVGCVALALGEVMRYHQWPTDAYDWKNMLDEYPEGQFTEAEGDAVGHLLADCGKAVITDYGIVASSAEIVSQPIALVDTFGYDIATQLHYRDFYKRNEWLDMIRNELASGRPVLLCAQSTELSHAFLCDGYNDRGQFHILWGNPTKEEDGWYDFDLLTPNQPKWHDWKSPEGGLNLLQSVCTGVQPPRPFSKENYVYAFSHIDGFLDDGSDGASGNGNGYLNVVTHNLANIGRNVHNGKVGLALTYKGDIVSILKYYDHDFDLEELTDTSYTDTMRVEVASPIEALGEYHIVPVFEENDSWVEARTSVGTPNYLSIDMTADGFSLKDVKAASQSLKILDLQFPDTLVKGTKPEFSVTIQNQGDTEYNGRIYFALIEVVRPTYNKVFNIQGLYLSPGETTTRSFSRTTFYGIPDGNYYLRIFTDMDLFTDSLIMHLKPKERIISVVPTGIEELRADPEDESGSDSATTYDLSGRIIHSKDTSPQIFIRNRKKYVR